MKILLDIDDFQKLVSGQVVEKTNEHGFPLGGILEKVVDPKIEIALQDIGYDVMLAIIQHLKTKLYDPD